MDQNEHQNLQCLIQFKTSSPFLKKVTQLLLSISIFYLLFYFSSSWIHSFNLYFTVFPLQLITHALNKNYMFLICNGILVHLAKTSGLVRCPSGFDLKDKILNMVSGDGSHTSPWMKDNYSLLEKEISESFVPLDNARFEEDEKEEEEEEEEEERVYQYLIEGKSENENMIVEDQAQEAESESINKGNGAGGGREEEEEEEEEEETRTLYIEYDEKNENEVENGSIIEEEGGGGNELLNALSTEELNKKFEDFIRRMKEDIRIETQQPVMVM